MHIPSYSGTLQYSPCPSGESFHSLSKRSIGPVDPETFKLANEIYCMPMVLNTKDQYWVLVNT